MRKNLGEFLQKFVSYSKMAENSWSGHNRLTSLRWQGSVVLYRHAMLSGRVKLVDQSDFSFHNTNQSYYTLQTRKCIHSPDGLTPDQIYDLYFFTILTLSKTFSRKIWKNLSSQFLFHHILGNIRNLIHFGNNLIII